MPECFTCLVELSQVLSVIVVVDGKHDRVAENCDDYSVLKERVDRQLHHFLPQKCVISEAV